MKAARIKEKVIFTAFGAATALCLAAFIIIAAILFSGIGTLRLEQLITTALKGGYFEMIIGTIYLLAGAAGVAGPVGLLAAIYLVEYAPRGKLTRIIDQAINNLAGVPSIVIGLFGYTFFCRQLGLGISLAAGWLTLTLMMLPIVIRGSEEAIKMVPRTFHDAALALGAPKWKAITSITVPAAAPGIITSILLGIARVAGETAAILFTSCVLITRGLPRSPLDPVMALAYNLFVKIVALGESPDRVFGIALILFIIVVIFAAAALAFRIYYRRRQLWLK
ncbi:phosphate ABC transporter permease PstA [Candidatus Bathyarchaeota archaeon]|nr:phosphate ABC transporter permease PstA [Candidatus Bathyarchaeota archaeon]